MFELRDYQQRAIVEIGARLKAHKRVVAVAPTGSGKTVIGAAFVAALPPKKRAIWIAHRVELLRQARDGLSAAGVADLGILSGPEKTNVGARVLVASIDTLRSREIPNVDLIVVDEAHRIEAKSYKDVIAARPNALVLGLTATPWRLDGKGLGDTFADMFVVAKPSELFEHDPPYLARPVTYGVGEDRAREIVKGLKSNRGDFSSRGLGAAMMKVLVGSVVTEWETHARGMQTIVFASGRDHGRQLTRDFVARGHAAEYIDGDTSPAERDAVLARLRSKSTTIVVNVDVLSEGFDCPAVNCVSLARPTKSRSRFLQYVGRALRPYDGRPVILDHTGNCLRFGAPDADQGWSLDGRALSGTSDALVKCCVACSAMIPAGAKECPACSTIQPLDVSEIERLESERLEVVAAERVVARYAPCMSCGVPFDHGDKLKTKTCSRACMAAMKTIFPPRACEHCGTMFKPSATNVRKGMGKYCGMRCSTDASKVKPRSCAQCASSFVPRRVTHTFCSRQCSGSSINHGPVAKSCERCSASFMVSYGERERRFCSVNCAKGDRVIERTCVTCSKKFLKHASRVAIGKGLYCSRECTRSRRREVAA